jgi:hypothetical protein
VSTRMRCHILQSAENLVANGLWDKF